ncbi:MAG: DUF1109 domain-containing protein [Proteobacteria bacterium]|nr:DUF1109 domain-containing protein [Pseudomonadota bacterium]
MKTDDLIDMLAKNIEPAERPRWRMRTMLTLLAGLAIAVALVLTFMGMRPDIGTATWAVLLKAAFSATAAASVLPLAMRLMRPGSPLGWRVAAVLLFVGVSILATAIALMGMPSGLRLRSWMGGGFPWCIVLIPIFAAPAAALMVWLARSLAPTRLTLSGAAIGALSGGLGAMAYAMYCPVDSVAFVTTWYVVGIAICAAIGAIVGSKLLRW